MSFAIESSRRFYDNHVSKMIHEKFPEYENRIAVGIAGEGSDCFGYDDYVSRDHDFGTGVCLWIPDEDMAEYGSRLSDEYAVLVNSHGGNNLTRRLMDRRGVMTIHGFYSSVLAIKCDTENCRISESDWKNLDHTCLATAVNGQVFRDDLGRFTAFRNLLMNYYPEQIWKIRIVNELHKFSAALQVNYARCMSRGDTVAARMCHIKGLEAAMELFFLMKRVYPPYYKWTYRRLVEIDSEGRFSELIRELSETNCDISLWKDRPYKADYLNMNDPIIALTERIAGMIVDLLRKHELTDRFDPYLERYVDEIISSI